LLNSGLTESEEDTQTMADQVNVNDKAPDFSLPRTLEEKVTLSDLLDDKKVVLAFYIFDFAGDADAL